MVWVKFNEKYHGNWYSMWSKKKSLAAAKKEAAQWNKFDNPEERLEIVATSSKKPRNLVKKYPNKYQESLKKIS